MCKNVIYLFCIVIYRQLMIGWLWKVSVLIEERTGSPLWKNKIDVSINNTQTSCSSSIVYFVQTLMWNENKEMFNVRTLVLSLFTIVKFDNEPCYSSSGDSGICMTSTECYQNRGVPIGSCASSYGVCCLCKTRHLIHLIHSYFRFWMEQEISWFSYGLFILLYKQNRSYLFIFTLI